MEKANDGTIKSWFATAEWNTELAGCMVDPHGSIEVMPIFSPFVCWGDKRRQEAPCHKFC